MATKKREYVSKCGKKVLLDISNMQQGTRPFRYVCLDADFLSDLAVGLNMEMATADELLRNALKNGLPTGMNINEYCFDRYSDRPVRNKSVHPDAVDNDLKRVEAVTKKAEQKASPDKTISKIPLIDSFISNLTAHEEKLGKKLSVEEKLALVTKMTKMDGKVLSEQDKTILTNAIKPQEDLPTVEDLGFTFE